MTARKKKAAAAPPPVEEAVEEAPEPDPVVEEPEPVVKSVVDGHLSAPAIAALEAFRAAHVAHHEAMIVLHDARTAYDAAATDANKRRDTLEACRQKFDKALWS